MTKTIINLEELRYYVYILEDLNGKVSYNNFDVLYKDLLENFNIRISRDQFIQLLEPTAEQLAKDLEIMYNNVS